MIEGGDTLFEVSEVAANRLLVCGPCPESGIEGSRLTVRKAMEALADKIDRFDEWGRDPDLMEERSRERRRRYREGHREEIRSRRKEAMVNSRLRKIGGTDNGTTDD